MSEAPSTPPTERRGGTPLEIFCWALYDWANSAYSTLSITILVFYITTIVLPGNAGTIAWGYGIGITMLVAAILSPILGAVADACANKRFWLAVTTLPAAGAATMMCFVSPERTWLVVALYLVANLGYELSQGFYNGFLPELATPETMNRVSAWGFALGYPGGGFALIVAILILRFGGSLGLPDGDELTSDFHALHAGRFAVAVPDGPYEVTVRLGDPAAAHQKMQISLEGEKVDEISTAAGQSVAKTYAAIVNGGELSVGLESLGGADQVVSIQGLEVRSKQLAAAQKPIDLKFDFGTQASQQAPGAIWVLPGDDYKPKELKDRFTSVAPSGMSTSGSEEGSEPPAELTFGWREGAPHGHDAVIPLRLQICLAIMGLWWAIFSLPALLVLRDRGQPRLGDLSMGTVVREAVGQVGQTLGNVRRYRTLFLFLIGFLIYNDGVQTIITQAPIFAQKVLNVGASDLTMIVLMIQFVALPGALGVGWLSDKLGEKPTLAGLLGIYIVWLLAAFFISTWSQFVAMAFVLALIMGGVQSVSRAIMGLMTPTDKTAEFFGFFNLSGKATSFMGPILFTSILAWAGSPHMAILSLLIFFIVGSAIVLPLNFRRGRMEAQAAGE